LTPVNLQAAMIATKSTTEVKVDFTPADIRGVLILGPCHWFRNTEIR
jgi:hypothetical protein